VRRGNVRLLSAKRLSQRNERSWRSVPKSVIAALAIALILETGFQSHQPKTLARAQALHQPPAVSALRLVSLGENIAVAQLMSLYLQAFDNQPGISIPFRELDYGRVSDWLKTILALDPIGQHPLFLASQVYPQVPDPARTRSMFDFVYQEFLADPARRWRWLAHSALAARHRLKDNKLALHYANEIARLAPHAPGWARQMQIFILEDIGEIESAKIMLGALIASGEVRDERELHFLTERLAELESAEKSSTPSKN